MRTRASAASSMRFINRNHVLPPVVGFLKGAQRILSDSLKGCAGVIAEPVTVNAKTRRTKTMALRRIKTPSRHLLRRNMFPQGVTTPFAPQQDTSITNPPPCRSNWIVSRSMRSTPLRRKCGNEPVNALWRSAGTNTSLSASTILLLSGGPIVQF